jgi:hypothetical protein
MSAKELTENPENAAELWPHTTYHGFSVLDCVYPLTQEFEKILKDRVESFQEVYLGYMPDTDQFIIGWDYWNPPEDEENIFDGCYLVFEVKKDNDKLVIKYPYGSDEVKFVGIGGGEVGGFYAEGGIFNDMKLEYPSLIDIRLD